MHNLALAMKVQGHDVTGSDDIIYDPAKSRLAANGLLPEGFGWFPERISSDIDLVILGMHAHADNPELKAAIDRKIEIVSFPEYLGRHSEDKIRVAICGSHGKTTTTSMVMHILKENNLDFDYAVGAQLAGFDLMVKVSDAPIIIIEGDEYLSSALDRRPKFVHYNPHIAVLTGVAWDHINVYPTYEEYLKAFVSLLDCIEPDGQLVYSSRDSDVAQFVSDRVQRKDIEPQPFAALDYVREGEWYSFKLAGETLRLRLFGEYNYQNLMAAWQVCRNLGMAESDICHAMKNFELPDKRMDIIRDDEDTLLIRDYAHSPSKVSAAVNSFVQAANDRPTIAVVEVHTYSSLNRHFIPLYKNALNGVDVAGLFYNPKNLEIKRLPEMDQSFIKNSFGRKDLVIMTTKDEIKGFLAKHMAKPANIILMGSSNFGGLDLTDL